jgi:two-component system, NtrC family, response regulator AtoC
MIPQKLLIIDDDDTIIFSFKTFLNDQKYYVEYACNGKEGLEKLNSFKPALVIADYKMPEMTGLEFIKAARIVAPSVPVIIMSAFGDSTTRALFSNEGALDYIEKPFDIEEIIELIDRSLTHTQSSQDLSDLEFIGENSKIMNIFSQIDRIKSTSISVLIQGESGTGKDYIASYIHKHSPYASGPFVSINCAAIPENLMESELFGYEKGAFTGAENKKIGKFEMAHEGTIFFDEIGDLPLNIQAKLLRVLQNKTYERVGGTSQIQSTTRIIAASNKYLKKMVDNGNFREDLFYRLSAFPINIPPIRDRKDDIPLLLNYFIKKYCIEFSKEDKHLTLDAISFLTEYSWPGNVREMQNVLSRIVLLEPKTTISKDIVNDYFNDVIFFKEENNNSPNISFLAKYTEKELLNLHANEVFKMCDFNKSETAKKLDINYRTLIKRLNIE